MPRYHVYMTDLVTAGFDIESPTPGEAADEVTALGVEEGEFVHAETAALEVCATDAQGSPVLEDVHHRWRALPCPLCGKQEAEHNG